MSIHQLALTISNIATSGYIADKAIIHNMDYQAYCKLCLACGKCPINEMAYMVKHMDHHDFTEIV